MAPLLPEGLDKHLLGLHVQNYKNYQLKYFIEYLVNKISDDVWIQTAFRFRKWLRGPGSRRFLKCRPQNSFFFILCISEYKVKAYC